VADWLLARLFVLEEEDGMGEPERDMDEESKMD
jgi:hypothetical protein